MHELCKNLDEWWKIQQTLTTFNNLPNSSLFGKHETLFVLSLHEQIKHFAKITVQVKIGIQVYIKRRN